MTTTLAISMRNSLQIALLNHEDVKQDMKEKK